MNKKSIFSFLIIIFLIPSAIYAQRGFRVGFNLAPTFSRASFIDSFPENFSRSYLPGINAGLGIHYGINNGISLYSGALYSSKGYKITNDTNTLKSDIRGSVTALEIPFGFYLRQPLSKRTFLRELVGISYCINFNSDTNTFRYPDNNPFALQAIVNRRTNFLVNIGVDIEHVLEAGHYLSFGMVYRHGFGLPMSLHVISNPTRQDEYFEMGYAGSYIGINLSVMFNLKGLKPQKGELFFE
jgi:hypothetical protein